MRNGRPVLLIHCVRVCTVRQQSDHDVPARFHRVRHCLAQGGSAAIHVLRRHVAPSRNSSLTALRFPRLAWAKRRRDGRGGYLVHAAEYQFVPRFEGVKVLPFGLVAMDNGEVLLIGAARTGRGPSVYGEMVSTRSADAGATWSDYEVIGYGPAVGLTYLGDGCLLRPGHHPEEGPCRIDRLEQRPPAQRGRRQTLWHLAQPRLFVLVAGRRPHLPGLHLSKGVELD